MSAAIKHLFAANTRGRKRQTACFADTIHTRNLEDALPSQVTVARIVNLGTQKRQGWIAGTAPAGYLGVAGQFTWWVRVCDEIASITRLIHACYHFLAHKLNTFKGPGDPSIHHHRDENRNYESCPSFAHRRPLPKGFRKTNVNRRSCYSCGFECAL
jgi:hypothetical protein